MLSGLKVLHKMSFDDIKLLSKTKTGRSGSVFDLDKIGLFRNQKSEFKQKCWDKAILLDLNHDSIQILIVCMIIVL